MIYAYVRNGEVTRALFDPAAMSAEVMIGLAPAVVMMARFAWVSLPGKGSRLPADAPAWERRLALIVHRGIYISVAALLLSGFAIALCRPGAEIIRHTNFGRTVVDRIALATALIAHHVSAVIFLVLILVHVAASFWHLLLRRDGVWESMVGGRWR